jgi:hypothetical protein
MKKKKQKTKTQAKKEADIAFGHYIRAKEKHICYTCGKRLEETKSQCGHYKSRSHLNTRYSERNCHCQCVGCNIFRSGNLTVYAVNLLKQYGDDILYDLDKDARKIKRMSVKDFERITKIYKLKINELYD